MELFRQVVLLVAVAATVVGLGRWLRVSQREHYIAGAVSRFAWRWWKLHGTNRAIFAAMALAAAGSYFFWPLALLAAAGAAMGPQGLKLRGRTSRLVWTRRLGLLTFALATLGGLALWLCAALGWAAPAVAVAAVTLPLICDALAALLKPVETLLARRWLTSATQRLNRVNPARVAITGSYGKTTVKNYLRHLLEGAFATVATPASFNNTAGLCRTVNEHLTAGTQVFVAEMGTYGRGEIAAMARWVAPSVSVLTGIGPVHLERFGTLEAIVAAKCEIFATSTTAVVNVDAPMVAFEADRLAASGIDVWRCSAVDHTDADVYVGPWGNANGSGEAAVVVRGSVLGTFASAEVSPTNVACAVAAACALAVPPDVIATRLADLPTTPNRRAVSLSASGVTVVDDTYNSNPLGAAAALDLLDSLEAAQRAVVTPGMVELGSEQTRANAAFAAAAANVADHLVIVNETNRASLTSGAAAGRCAVHYAPNRDAAVRWVRHNLRSGDAVLYENDLPDHYP